MLVVVVLLLVRFYWALPACTIHFPGDVKRKELKWNKVGGAASFSGMMGEKGEGA